MSEACYTARTTIRQNAKALIAELTLNTNERGQYVHDDAVVFITGIKRQLGSIFNPEQPGKGMALLAEKGPNELTTLKSTDMFTAAQILAASKKEAEALAKKTGMPQEKPAIETRGDAQEEADRKNYAIQATIGAKEGAAEAITEKVGSDITDHVLRNADGNDYKGVDDYTLHDILEAVMAGAIRPNLASVLEQVVETINFTFDMRKKISNNMETLRAKSNRIIAYGINHDESFMALTLLANVEAAAKHEWGREFQPAMQTIRRKYKYNHCHDSTSLTDILAELTMVDTVRNLQEAPEPTMESANAVAESVSLLQQLLQSNKDYEESAMAATSDSESSGGRKARSKSRGKKTSRRGRSASRNSGGDGERNKCPHCKKYKRKKAHPNTPESKCFWNKDYKGYRKDWICREMEMKYVPRHKFSAALGGYPEDSDSGSE